MDQENRKIRIERDTGNGLSVTEWETYEKVDIIAENINRNLKENKKELFHFLVEDQGRDKNSEEFLYPKIDDDDNESAIILL